VADGSAAIPPTQVIDLSKARRGLIDSHTHIFLWARTRRKRLRRKYFEGGIALRAARATYAAKRALEQGFTTLRDVETEGAGYGDVGIKQAIDEGTIPGPRIFASTPLFHKPAATTWRLRAGTRHAKGAQLIDAQCRRERRRASSSITARTG